MKFEAWAKSTGELERRMGDVGLPPKDPAEYKVEVPATLKEVGIDLSEKETKDFQTLAHGLKLSQKQYEGVMNAYFQSIERMGLQSLNYGKAKLNGELLAHYKTPEAMKENIGLAFRTLRAYGDEGEIEAAMGAQGNAPAWVYKVLAKVGKELGEDPGVNPDAILDGDSLEHLMRGGPGKEDSPYWNKDHPQHKATVAKVTRYHEAKAAERQRKAA